VYGLPAALIPGACEIKNGAGMKSGNARPARVGVVYVVAAGALIVVAAVAVAILNGRSSNGGARSVTRNVTTESTSGGVKYDVSPTPETLRDSAVALASAAEGRISDLRAKGVVLPDPEALRAELAEALGLYLGGSRDEFVAYLERRGRPVHDAFRGPEGDARWSESISPVRLAPCSAAGLNVQCRLHAGRAVDAPEPVVGEGRVLRMSRPDSDSARVNAGEVVEVVIPTIVSAVDGTDAEAQWGISFAYDSGARRWTILEMAFYDLPRGLAVRALPLP
jgi:hypothetical protein